MNPARALEVAREIQIRASDRQHRLYFHGESMEPFLTEGDQIVVERIAWEDIEVGDIITYRHAGQYPARRVIRKHDDVLELRCEGWPWRVFEATRGQVLGRVVARRRGDEWLESSDPGWRASTRKALAKSRRRGLFEALGRFVGFGRLRGE
jgi:signal peptidase I